MSDIKEDVLRALAPREERIEVGGRELVVRELSTAAELEGMSGNPDAVYLLLVRCVRDAGSGEPVFTDADVPAIKQSSSVKLAGLIRAVTRVNGDTVEGAAKNSEAGPGAG